MVLVIEERIILGIGHMGLVAGGLAGPHLGIGESDFERIETGDNIGQFCRGHAMGQAHQLLARHIHVDQHARHLT